jgi:redox-sensitive bicupin YhaK (pirin superfamily)
MIRLRRAEERRHDRRRKQDVWRTFDPEDRTDALTNGFGTLEILDENRLPPGAGVPRYAHREAEIVTYVREGAIAQEDSAGRSGVVPAGEFQRMTAGRSIRRSAKNASRSDGAHIFQVWLRPSEAELEPGHAQRRFSVAERRGGLCVVASPDGRKGSLRVHADALLYSAILDPGQHVVHELAQGRSAWLHVVQGELTLGDIVLTAGDGAGVTAKRAVSLTAREGSELLLLDLGEWSSGKDLP